MIESVSEALAIPQIKSFFFGRLSCVLGLGNVELVPRHLQFISRKVVKKKREVQLMKFFAFCLFAVLLFLISSDSWAMDLKAGAAAVSLNPPQGISLAGYGGKGRRHWIGSQNKYAHYLKASKGSLDDIRVKAVVLQFGTEKVAFVSIDLIAAPGYMIPVLGQRLKDIGIDGKHIFLSATHTHSGPSSFTESKLWEILAVDKFVPEVAERFTDRVEQAIREAYAVLRPARLAVGQKSIPNVTRNRRGNPDLDPEMTLIRIDDLQGAPLANIVNFPIHGTVLSMKNLLLSADVPGAIERGLQKKSDAVSIFVNGAEGDVSPDSHHPTVDELTRLGDLISEQTFILWKSLKTVSPRQFKILHLAQPIGRAELNVFACLNYNKASGKWMQKLSKNLPTSAQLSGFTIDDHAFVTVPGEPITVIGEQIKALGAVQGFESTSVFGLTNDHIGYIVDEKEFKRGGYESCGNMYGPHLGEKILAGAARILSELGQ